MKLNWEKANGQYDFILSLKVPYEREISGTSSMYAWSVTSVVPDALRP